MSDDKATLLQQHIDATARLLSRALVEFGQQMGQAALAAIDTALREGGMARATTTMSPAGFLMISFDLIGPKGDIVNIGRVEFESNAPTLN